MGKLRHIALSVPDAEAAALFFEQAFGLERVGKTLPTAAARGIYLSDGVVNLALLQFAPDVPIPGYDGPRDRAAIIHFGVWVDDFNAAEQSVYGAGGTYVTGKEGDGAPHNYVEVKYASPEGIVFDVTQLGWKGASKDVVPVAKQPA
jgi:methylmalonyl-CoA/ethylmalonyl-CoA epimerase